MPVGDGSPTGIAGLPLVFDHWGFRHPSRRDFAVKDLDLRIEAGRHVLLLGASGIGKSTILAGAAGILGTDAGSEATEDVDGGVTEGRILVGGVPTAKARGRVGLVLQDPDAQTIFQRLGDNVAFGPENMDVARDRIWERVDECLHAVGLDGVELHRPVMHLSGGQLQRLALAGVLAMRPGVLLLDEPTANLDPDGVDQVVDAVGGVVRSTGATMVLVEHRAEPWVDLIDRVVVLGPGAAGATATRREPEGDREAFPLGPPTVVVADGTPDEVFRDGSLDLAGLGVWVPDRYRRPRDVVMRIRTDDEPPYPPDKGTGTPVLRAEDLSIGRDGRAISEHIDLTFCTGQITALVGANGAGKSTLSLTLAGLLPPVAGTVKAVGPLAEGLEDPEPLAWSSRRLASRISYVFQNPEHQFARGTVLEEVMLGPVRTGMAEGEARDRATGLLRRFGLERYAAANPYTLSGGEKRRLTVAAALAATPTVLILDEPTFGQDRRTWMQIVRLIHGLRGDGVSIIVVTHDRDLVTALGARIVELVPKGSTREWASGAADAVDGAGERPREDSRIAVSRVEERHEDVRPSSRSRFLASLNPSYRLIGAFLSTLPLLFSLDVVSASVALGLEVVALAIMGFTPWRVIRSCWPVIIGAPGSALAVLLYGKIGGDVWWRWGMIVISDRSADLAVATGIRILAVGIPAIITVLGIDATDLADSFSQVLHLPDRFVYGGLAGMRLFSVLRDDWAALTASRRSRGLGDDNAVRAFLPQAFALLVLSIRRSTSLATAMEARGFGGTGPRSHARVSLVRTRDRLFLVGCLAVPAVALAAAAVTGSFAFLGE
ncbi:ATP-binding cassette domain-containing protein [uncultured Bifidobacterium sp.]|uniref:ATP-binding cassette domain-containing protein n=1 Tax=uncultured Bifidobacterium sp. TaxID=165187 RepID=UPI0028DB904A|nr:ATP-binding cassette domain-containing protein [uncultured Bifidobacterium sp.]